MVNSPLSAKHRLNLKNMAGVIRIKSVVICLFLFLASQGRVAGAPENKIKQSETQLQQIEGEIKTLRADLTESGLHRNQLLTELKESEKRIGLNAKRLHHIGELLRQQQARFDDLEQRYAVQQEALQTERDALKRQLRAAYAMGRQQRLKILLNQQDPAIVSRLMVYYDYFNEARLRQMGRIRQAMDGLQQMRVEISNERAQLLDLESRELAEQTQLEANRQQRQEVVDSLGLEMRDMSDRLAALMKDQEQLSVLLTQLREQQLSAPLEQTAEALPISSLQGKLRWPVKGRIEASFGTTKAGNLKWDGMIIAAPEGNEVYAIHRGRVAFADWLRGFGLLIIIDHGSGYMSLYGHNQSLFRETGEWVEAGERVALVGRSGGRSDSGIYFGIRIGGDPVNPKKWCQRIQSGNRVSFLPAFEQSARKSVKQIEYSGLESQVSKRAILSNVSGSAVKELFWRVTDRA